MHPQGRNGVKDGKRTVSCCARKSLSGDGEETGPRAVASGGAPARVPGSKGQGGTGQSKLPVERIFERPKRRRKGTWAKWRHRRGNDAETIAVPAIALPHRLGQRSPFPPVFGGLSRDGQFRTASVARAATIDGRRLPVLSTLATALPRRASRERRRRDRPVPR